MRGAIAYYAFLMVFMVAFVATVGMLRNGITGNAVLEPMEASLIPALSVEGDLLSSIIPPPVKPVPARRMLITPNAGVAEEQLYALAPPRHFFAGKYTTDITDAEAAALAAIIESVPLYRPSDFTRPTPIENDRTTMIIDTGLAADSPLRKLVVQCRDFTHGPEVREACTDGHGHGTRIAEAVGAQTAALTIYKVCDANGQCFADDIAAAVAYAIAHGAQRIVLALSGSPSAILSEAITVAEAKGITVIQS